MRSLFKAALAVTACTLSLPAVAQKSQVGVWEVTGGKTCSITQAWKGDSKNAIAWGLSYMAKGEALLLFFADTDTTFKDSEELKLELKVDSTWKSKVDAVASDKNTAATVLPATSAAINALMNGKELEMTMVGKPDKYSGTYSLDDTRKAIAALDGCKAQSE
jgi:ABC-type nitrate/sulfonate/bicarbonate transport system substrate-binding protein